MFQADKYYFPAASHSQTVCVAFPKEDGKCDTISHYHMLYSHFMCVYVGFLLLVAKKHVFLRHCFLYIPIGFVTLIVATFNLAF